MANINFNLREKGSDKPTPIRLIVRWDNQRLVYPTYEKILPKYWNTEKQKVRETKSFPAYPEFNTRLNQIRMLVDDTFRSWLNDHNNQQPTTSEFKRELDRVFIRQPKEEKFTLISFIEMFIEESKKTKTPGTVISYKNAFKHLKGYIAFKKLKTLDFKDIDLEFYSDFTDYLSKHLGHSDNTISKIIKKLKTFLSEATERNYNDNMAFRSRKFKTFQKPTEKIYLTEEEITAIYELDLSNNKRLDKVRDLFIIG